MNLRFRKYRSRAITNWEVLVILAALLLVAVALLLPALATAERRAARVNCLSNLKQIELAFLISEGDNHNEYPMNLSVTNGGAMELIATDNVAGLFGAISNDVYSTRILICPADAKAVQSASPWDFGSNFCNKNISYFVGMDARNKSDSRMVLVGDDNFVLRGNPMHSGVWSVSTNAPIVWNSGRHFDSPFIFWSFAGNLGYADGRVAEIDDSELRSALSQTGLATNRIAIP